MSLFLLDAGEEWGRGQEQTFLLVQEILNRGLAVRLFVEPGSPLHRKASAEGLPVCPVSMRRKKNLFTVLRLAKHMKRYKCRLVHLHDAHSFAVGSAAARLAKIPLRIISYKGTFPWKETRLSRAKFSRDIDGVIAVSQEVKSVLAAQGISRDKITVIPDGIDYSHFENISSGSYLRKELSFAPDEFLVGVVARFACPEDTAHFLDTVLILKEKEAKIKVIIMKSGPLEIELSKRAKDTPSEDIVFFLGFREDIPRILASLDLFLLLSVEECAAGIVREAMASRLPVVAIQGGGSSDVVVHGETGFLVPPRDAEILADAIIRIYRSGELGKKLGQKGYELFHQKFSAKAIVSRIIHEYERIAQNKNIKL